MSTGLREKCDWFIRRCQDAIAMRDIDEARRILIEATPIFESIIPRWTGGLMSRYTGYYLDDIHMILGKLSTFKGNGYQATPRDFTKTSYTGRAIETDDWFDEAVAALQSMRANPALEQADSAPGQVNAVSGQTDSGSDIASVIAKVRELQASASAIQNPAERWEAIKPYLRWVSTLDIQMAEVIMPLIARCAG